MCSGAAQPALSLGSVASLFAQPLEEIIFIAWSGFLSVLPHKQTSGYICWLGTPSTSSRLLPPTHLIPSISLLSPHGSASTTALSSVVSGLFLLHSCLEQTRVISPKGTCAACQGEVGNGSSSSCFTFAPTPFPPLPPRSAPPLVLSELFQENPTSDSTCPLGSAW